MTKQTKAQIFNRIQELVREFCGSDEPHGIKSWNVERLQALCNRYEVMMQHEREYRKLFKEHFTDYYEFQALCLNPNPPEWFHTMWNHHMMALHIWRGMTVEEAEAKVAADMKVEA